jgi:sugar lactone lactonase YvrE
MLGCVGLAVLMMAGSGMGQRQPLLSGKMYWTDLGIDKIQRVNLDGTGLEDLVTTGLIAPRGIALDVAGGKMYWTDAGSSKIQRANQDGSTVEDLIITYSSGPMGGGGQRYGIALATAR